MRTSKGGFTLVEILTVIAIIVILAAVLLPVLGRAREQSNRTHCMSNLHQIATALKLYKLDERAYPYDLSETAATQRPRITGERWFGSGTDADGDGTVDTPDKRNPGYGLASLYPNYVETVRLFNCPDNDTDTLKVEDGVDPPDPPVNATEAAPATDKVNSYQSYDGFDRMLGELKYCRSWRVFTTADDPHYARQLKWRYPPEDTVVTWCTQHRSIIDPSDTNFGLSNQSDRDLVLYLDGTTKTVPAWITPKELGSGHLSIPGELE